MKGYVAAATEKEIYIIDVSDPKEPELKERVYSDSPITAMTSSYDFPIVYFATFDPVQLFRRLKILKIHDEEVSSEELYLYLPRKAIDIKVRYSVYDYTGWKEFLFVVDSISIYLALVKLEKKNSGVEVIESKALATKDVSEKYEHKAIDVALSEFLEVDYTFVSTGNKLIVYSAENDYEIGYIFAEFECNCRYDLRVVDADHDIFTIIGAGGRGITVVEFDADEESFEMISKLNIGKVKKIETTDDYIYALVKDGIVVIDSNDLENLKVVGKVQISGVEDIKLVGNTIYAGVDDGIAIIDVSDKENPRIAGKLDIGNKIRILA